MLYLVIFVKLENSVLVRIYVSSSALLTIPSDGKHKKDTKGYRISASKSLEQHTEEVTG